MAPFLVQCCARLENRKIVEADDCAAVTLERRVVQRAFRTMYELGHVDLG